MDIPIRIVKTNYDSDGKYKNEVSFPLKGQMIFHIKESEDVRISFIAAEEIIVSYESCISDNYYSEGKNFIDFHSNPDSDRHYFAGYYGIKLMMKDTVENYRFFVRPSSLEYENITFIRRYVNSFSPGLSANITKIKHAVNETSNSNNNNAYTKYLFLAENFNNIVNNIASYLNSPSTELQKETITSARIKNLDSKSIKWLVTKGASYNKDIMNPDTIVSRELRHNYDNSDNQYFKIQLDFWNREIADVTELLEVWRYEINQIISDTSLALEKERRKYDKALISTVALEGRKKELYGRIKNFEKKQSEYIDLFNDYSRKIKDLQKYKSVIEKALYDSWVSNVTTSKKSREMIKDSRLKLLQQLRNRYKTYMIKNDLISRYVGLSFANKTTPALFETFVYVLIIRGILEPLGFSLVDEDKVNYQVRMSTAGTITLKNDGIYCDVIYEHTARSIRDFDDTDSSEYCSINSNHRSPDFILSFYRGGEIPFAATIVEVKWRALRKIYNPEEEIEVEKQLYDYLQMGYYDNFTGKVIRGIVTCVFAIYPDADPKYTVLANKDITLLGIKPCEEMSDEKPITYLKEVIGDVINQHNV